MIEFNGWVTLKFHHYHDGFIKQDEFISQLKNHIKENFPLTQESKICDIKRYNLLDTFTINGQHNHKDSAVFYIIEIFKWIAENGTGSYGILYIYDDEDENNDNEFQVYVLKKGKLTKQKDPFLSPYFPEVEDEYDEKNPPKDFDF